MRAAIATLLTAGFLVAMVGALAAQDKATTPSRLDTRTVTGTVQSASSNAIVVRGMEKDKEREWAFSVDDKTTIRKGGQGHSAAALKEGDRVTVNYAERDGKIVAQSVTVMSGTGSSSGSPARGSSPSK